MKKWDLEKIKQAIDKYYQENGRYPTSQDFDMTKYLPDSSTIRLLFGGVPKLRELLGYKFTNYTKGETRSSIVRGLDERAKKDEERLYIHLKNIFGEIFIHREKQFDHRNRVDFYIYHKDGIFAVDTFYPKHYKALANIYNLKEKKYLKFKEIIYLVSTNPNLSNKEIKHYLLNKKTKVPDNIFLMDEKTFLNDIKRYHPLNYSAF